MPADLLSSVFRTTVKAGTDALLRRSPLLGRTVKVASFASASEAMLNGWESVTEILHMRTKA